MEIIPLYNLLQKQGFSTDTRSITEGQIFIALQGETFDGNTLAINALEQGASYALIDNPHYKTDERCILVENTLTTLQELAKIHRKHFSIPILVIGGSNGKTTTKELVHAVLSKKYTTHTTSGNLNNNIGVPMTILNMKANTEIAVIEIGANHPGEHRELMDILAPTHVLITNNGADHLEGFESLAGVRKANKEIYDWAHTHHAHAFVNQHIDDLGEDSNNLSRTVYPMSPYESTSSLYASIRYNGLDFTSSLFGSYNEANMLAALAIGEYFEVPLSDIQSAIAEYVPTLKRSQVIQKDDYTLIVDCYNANPTSMSLALRDFAHTSPTGKRIFVIGDMLEMGSEESRLHKEILDLTQSIADPHDIVWCVGPRFGMYKNDFPFAFFNSAADAQKIFTTLDLAGKIVFLKASRGIRLEDILK